MLHTAYGHQKIWKLGLATATYIMVFLTAMNTQRTYAVA